MSDNMQKKIDAVLRRLIEVNAAVGAANANWHVHEPDRRALFDRMKETEIRVTELERQRRDACARGERRDYRIKLLENATSAPVITEARLIRAFRAMYRGSTLRGARVFWTRFAEAFEVSL